MITTRTNRRIDTMRIIRAFAREADSRGDVTMQTWYAETWRGLATEAEACRAPKYLTWPGRR